MTLGWAILGTGRFAKSRIAPALNKAHDCKAVAVVSRDRTRAQDFASEFGIPRAYDDLGAALADPTIEAVWIAIPHALHYSATLEVARAGRHILCEKPLAIAPPDARAMVRACSQAGVVLGTGFQLRHHPLHVELQRLVRSIPAGPAASASAEWSTTPQAEADGAEWRRDPAVSGGGIFTATGVHALDLLRFILDDEIESVSALAESSPSSGRVERGLLATLRFRRGTLATVRAMHGVFAPSNDLVIECRHALLRTIHSLDEPARGILETSGIDARLSGVPVGTDLYALQAEAFAHAVTGGHEPSASGLDGLRACEATQAIYDSAATGKTIHIET